MIIVLEGVDKTGKTALANRLEKEHGYVNVSFKQPEKGTCPYQQYVKAVLDVKTLTVFDRLHVGERVYGPLYRKRSMLDLKMERNLDLLLLARGAVFVHCTSTIDVLSKRFEEYKEDFASVKDIKALLEGFDAYVSRTLLPVVTYDDFQKQDALLESVVLRTKDVVVPEIIRKTRYVGPLRPRVVLVGEVNNTKAAPSVPREQLPFDLGRSSKVLFDAVEELGWSGVGITNAIKAHLPDEDGTEILGAEFDALGDPFVVALGHAASKRLRVAEIPHVTVQHPQYVSRFKKRSKGSVASQLEPYVCR